MQDRGWDRLAELVSRVDISRFPVRMEISTKGSQFVLTMPEILDRRTGAPMSLDFSWNFYVRDDESNEEILRAIHGCVREAVLHELSECFRVDGELFEDPHAYDHLKDTHGRS